MSKAGQRILDMISPDEADLLPSARTWARIVRPFGWPILELRDPNSGQSPDPETKPRHQYMVARNVLWVLVPVNVVMACTGIYYLSSDRAGRHWGDRLADTRVVPA